MKKVLFLTSLVALSSVAFAQSKKIDAKKNKSESSIAAVTATPKAEHEVTFKQSTIDLGNIPQGVPAEAEFVFTNTGKSPIVIQNVRAACGCTTPSYTKETILPGKSGNVKAVYNAATPGAFNKNITVTTEAGSETLWIKGNVEATPEASVPANNNMMKK